MFTFSVTLISTKQIFSYLLKNLSDCTTSNYPDTDRANK